MVFSKEDDITVKNIEMYTGVPAVQIKKVFRVLLNEIICNYEDDTKEVTHIPLLGEINLNYNGDIIVRNNQDEHCKQADISIIFQASEMLKRVVGQIADNEETDLEKFLKSQVAQTLNASMT